MTSATEAPILKNKGTAKQNQSQWQAEDDFLAQEFDPFIKYMFELAEQTLPREHPVIDFHTKRPLPHQPFIPKKNLVLTSHIIWKGQRRGIRYYDGCMSIFIDEQPKEKETIDQFIAQTQTRWFIDGKLGIYGDERMLLLFVLASSFNAMSPFRTRTSNEVYIPCDTGKKAAAEAQKLDLTEQAMELAKNAPYAKILVHADFLGIPLKDLDSMNDLSEKEVRTAYRLRALGDAKNFIESYGNKDLDTKYYIKKALLDRLIDTWTDPNRALWKGSGREICGISGIKSFQGQLDRLFEFSQLEEGQEFKIQLEGLYKE